MKLRQGAKRQIAQCEIPDLIFIRRSDRNACFNHLSYRNQMGGLHSERLGKAPTENFSSAPRTFATPIPRTSAGSRSAYGDVACLAISVQFIDEVTGMARRKSADNPTVEEREKRPND